MRSRQALELAQEVGLDLVLVADSASPPVAKIIDYGKYRYETKKREKENKKVKQEVKGIKISPRIAEHDLQNYIRHATKFLQEGHKVRVTCRFRARELVHPDIGRTKLERFAAALEELSAVERMPSLDGNQMIMVLAPKSAKKSLGKQQDAKTENKQDSRETVQNNGVGKDNPKEGLQQPPVPPQVVEQEETPGTGA
jgi:translation initiation factor IF-3